MKRLSVRLLQDDSGFLTFEWIMLITVLVIGITGGLTAVRDALNWELGGVSGAIVSLDLSYLIKHPVKIKWRVGDFPGGSSEVDDGQGGTTTVPNSYLSGTAVGSHYHYTPQPIYYRDRGGAQVGDGNGLLQKGNNGGITTQTVPSQTITVKVDHDKPTYINMN